jgi:hypothetical protein
MEREFLEDVGADMRIIVIFYGAAAPSGPGPPHSRGF